ncbi:VOC family protein [Furfurilactobacillus siliginis]|uniref:Glyoxalase n=1 Tax=Furfurilactobacillus siliginis TaxID=348151 RepID=A0A0R2L3L9_9LACO|nr:VOC family protein [Furfurilactobacillus siliginis]KRN96393.1 hypothetical protein IV55_GL001359 [Furfurilactobacillus siliginis]GEK29311.1 glyoxalase [Furfurilactobacillus siliginis]
MNVRTISQYHINVVDAKRAWRFYHEVFDMPDTVLDDGTETVTVGGKLVTFNTVSEHEPHTDVAHPDFTLQAHDRIDDLMSHLQNYWVPIIAGPIADGDLQAVYVNDFEGNLIKILERAK